MNGLGMLRQTVGCLLLRCLVGKYGTILLTGALAILLGAGAYLSLVYDSAGSGGADQGTVYSVAAVDANLVDDPGTWLGRTIQIRGEVVPCMAVPSEGSGPGAYRSALSCAVLTSGSGAFYGLNLEGLRQSVSATANTLPMARAGFDPVRAVLRRVPLLSRVVPAPQALHWGVVATYRVQLASVHSSMCGLDVCNGARLLDAAP